MASQHKSLGRGLGSIISGGLKQPSEKPSPRGSAKAPAAPAAGAGAAAQSHLFSEIPLEKISPSPYQARRDFPEEEIAQLAESIASEGLIQPVVVRAAKGGMYELVAGERRFRACKKLGLKRIAAFVQQSSDSSAAVKGLIENLQRSDLNPMEEAQGIASLISNFKMTQDAAAQRLGKPRSSIANSLRLLSLPGEIQGFISKGLITQGHAKVLLGLDDKGTQVLLARRIIESSLNVRSTEDAVRRMKNERERQTPGTGPAGAAQSAVIRSIQNKISSRLNASVEIRHAPKKGKIIIEYIGNDDLQRILEIIGVEP